MSNLTNLITRVEEVNDWDQNLDKDISLWVYPDKKVVRAAYDGWQYRDTGNYVPRYTISLDAIRALHDEMLPGWVWGRDETGAFWVHNNNVINNGTGWEHMYTGTGTPAGAWVAAILRAKYTIS